MGAKLRLLLQVCSWLTCLLEGRKGCVLEGRKGCAYVQLFGFTSRLSEVNMDSIKACCNLN